MQQGGEQTVLSLRPGGGGGPGSEFTGQQQPERNQFKQASNQGSGDSQFDGRERVRYARDQLLQLRETVEVHDHFLKIKQELDADLFGAGLFGEGQNWSRSETNPPSQTQSRYSAGGNRDWRSHSARGPPPAGEERSWESLRDREFTGQQQPERNQFKQASNQGSGDSRFDGRERVRYARDQLLQLRETVEVHDHFLKIKQELDADLFGAGLFGEGQNWSRSETNPPSQTQSRYSAGGNRDWRSHSARGPPPAGEERSWESLRDREFTGQQQPERNQFKQASNQGSGDSRFDGRERVRYARDQLLQLRETVEVHDHFLKIKQELDADLFGAGLFGEGQNWSRSETNPPSQTQSRYSAGGNRDWRSHSARGPPPAGEERSWESLRDREFTGQQQPERNQFKQASNQGSGDSRFDGRERVRYARDQLLQLRETVEVHDHFLKIKQELDADLFGAGLFGEGQNWSRSETNPPSQTQSRYSAGGNRDWRSHSARGPPPAGEERSWESLRDREFTGQQQPERNQFKQASNQGSGDSRFDGRERVRYARDQLLQLRETVEVHDHFLKIKQELDADLFGAGLFGEGQNWSRSETNPPSQTQSRYSAGGNRDWRSHSARGPPPAGEERSWESLRDREFTGQQQPERNQFKQASNQGSGDSRFDGRERVRYARDQLLQIRETVEVHDHFLKIKQELDADLFGAGLFGEGQNWSRGETNPPSQTQSCYSAGGNRDWRSHYERGPPPAGEERSWESLRDRVHWTTTA